MKKTFLLALAAVAVTLASCGPDIMYRNGYHYHLINNLQDTVVFEIEIEEEAKTFVMAPGDTALMYDVILDYGEKTVAAKHYFHMNSLVFYGTGTALLTYGGVSYVITREQDGNPLVESSYYMRPTRGSKEDYPCHYLFDYFFEIDEDYLDLLKDQQ